MNDSAGESPESWVIDVDAQNFEQEVIARSTQMPVIVDFWAEWCEPCKVLGAILEKAAREGAGRFLLARVDAEHNPELAQIFRVQNIPMVVALVDGRLADAFQGATPEAEVLAFLDRVAPGSGASPDSPVSQAETLAAGGDLEGAAALLQEHLTSHLTDAAARIALAGHLLDLERADQAKLVVEELSEEEAASPEARTVISRIALAENAGDAEELQARVDSSPEDAGARTDLGRALVVRKEYKAGLEQLLEAVGLDPTGEGVAAKQAMLEVFEILGLEDPTANDYRFKLSLLLFS
jgi:putative thioredoxin